MFLLHWWRTPILYPWQDTFPALRFSEPKNHALIVPLLALDVPLALLCPLEAMCI